VANIGTLCIRVNNLKAVRTSVACEEEVRRSVFVLLSAALSSANLLPLQIDMSSDNGANNLSGPDGTSTAKPPTKIRIIEDAEATGETAAAYDFWRAGSGRQQVPGIIKCFGSRPDFLRRVIEFGNTIHFSEGHLSRRYKELIASYVSYLNRCPY
jgi:hypothetical protein